MCFFGLAQASGLRSIPTDMTCDSSSIREQFEKAGQGHVFRFWDDLDDAERSQLLEDARQIDPDEVNRLVKELVQGKADEGLDTSNLEPAPYAPLPENGGDAPLWEKAREAGEEALKAGRVACFTVAGGQGTRLGYDGPKGTFPVTPVKEKSLFQVFAEKVLAGSRLYGKPLHWFIMTSQINHEQTLAHFDENDYFGLSRDQVHFFSQGLMPAVTPEGKIILAKKNRIAMSPDGHGGSLRALVRSGSIDKMREVGADLISYFQVDNPLHNFLAPELIGFHVLGNSELSSKMIPKAYAKEKVGHFCVQNGRHVVIEYSDLPDELAEATNENGELKYRAGSVALHVFDREFVQKVGDANNEDSRLPFHRANKKIPFVDDSGTAHKPSEPNGYKFEMFVFDSLPFAQNPVIIEGRREDDFSPVKNAEGVDSPQTCKDDQMRQFARWLLAAGELPEVDETNKPAFALEVSALFAYDQRRFVERWRSLDEKPGLVEGLYIE